MKNLRRLFSLLLIVAMACSLLPASVSAAGHTLNDSGYTRISGIPNTYVASQGMAADENYVYSLKTPSGDHNNAIIYRTSIHDGSTIALTNGDNPSTSVLNGLGHGNDMAAVEYNGKTYLYVTTMYHVGHAEFSAHTIWKLEVSGNTVRKVAYYDITNGGAINFVALALHSFENGVVRLLGSVSTMVFYFDIGINQGSGTVPCTYIAPLNFNDITEPTGAPGYSRGNYGEQGMTYNNGILYFVMTSNYHPRNGNMIIAYDLSNLADGSLRQNVQAHTIYLTSSYYWYFLEIESLDCVNGRMYFTANAGSSAGYYNNEDFVGCFNQLYDTDPNGMLLEFESGSRETHWGWRHYIGSAGSPISPNPTAGNGYLSGTLGVMSVDGQTSTDSFVRMTAFDVLYKIKAGDIMEIGFDYTHISGTAPNSAAVFFTTNTIGYFTPDRMFAGTSHTFHNGRNVLQFALSSTSGGAVGEFISQLRIDLFDGGSNDFKAKYAIDYIYIGQPQGAPQNKLDYMGNGDFLFMDFVASAPMSANNNWIGNNVTALVNQSNGTLNGDILGGDPYLCTERMPTHVIRSGDIIEIRLKSTITSGNAGHMEVFYAINNGGYNGTNYFAVPVYPNGEYQVAYLKLPANTVGQTLTGVRVDPVSSGGNEALKGSYSIDYIYVGRPNNSPKNKQEHTGRFLLVDFDKESPLCETNNWITHDCTVTGDTATGVLKGNYQGSDPYAVSQGNILYAPQKGDIVEIRLKSNVTSGNYGVTEFFYTTLNDPNYGGQKYICHTAIPNNTYQTIRMTLPDSAAGEVINGIRIDPVAGTTTLQGTFEVDYIYVGPKDQAPGSIYTVTFCNEDGTVLQELTLSQGETAVYSGKEPTKAYDAQTHYTFNGWVDSKGNPANLTNIQADLKVYASFRSEAHSYSSGITLAPTCSAEGTKTYSCTCGRSYEETLPMTEHTPVADPAIAPTCTQTGLTEGSHCSVCNAVLIKQEVLPTVDHSYIGEVTTSPTCHSEGVKTYTCTKCNHSYTETIPTTDHSYTSAITTAPTCTANGVRTFTCGNCGDTYTESVPALEHSPVTDAAVPATCTNSGMTEGSHCSVCNAVLVAQEFVARLGHDYVCTDLGDGTHAEICSRCDKTKTAEAHTPDANGVCTLCGNDASAEPIVDESIKIYHTLDLASDISITFAVPQTALASYDSYYLECVLPEYSGNTQTGTKTVRVDPVVSGSYYYFTLTGITAVRMGDMVDAVLHMTKDGQSFISKTDRYSVSTYAYAMLNSSTDSKMLTLCADLLRYGAEAQSYKGYRTDSLVDADMTEKHRSYLSDAEALRFNGENIHTGDLANPVITWLGKTLDLGSKVGLKFVFNAKNYSGNVENLSLWVSYKGGNGETKTVTLTDITAFNAYLGQYSFTFYGLLASELRTVVEVAVYEGEIQLSETLRYSAESYAAVNTTGKLAPLCKALFAYSDSAKTFFAK